jgi:DNA-binding MarR family transcriptional regulator
MAVSASHAGRDGREPDRSADPAELAGRLRLAVARLARLLRQQDPSDLGTGLASALATIDRRGPLTFGELACVERIAPPSVTAIVRKLEERGLIERSPDDRDRRVCRLSATPAGRRHLTAARARRTAWLTVRLADLDPRGLERLTGAIEALEELLGTEAETGP